MKKIPLLHNFITSSFSLLGNFNVYELNRYTVIKIKIIPIKINRQELIKYKFTWSFGGERKVITIYLRFN